MHSAFCSLDPVKFDIAVQEMKPWRIDISKGISIPTLFALNHHGISVTRHFLKVFAEVDPCPLHRHFYKPIINCLSPYFYNTQSLSSVCRFRTWVIMAPHNLLSLVVPSNICPIVILPSLPLSFIALICPVSFKFVKPSFFITSKKFRMSFFLILRISVLFCIHFP